MQSLLPYNSTPLEKGAETVIREALATDVPIDTLWSAERCPLELLPFLAWALSVDHWDSDWPESRKRAVIQASVFVHRHKGTAGAVKAALAALDLGVTISEWFEHGGERYSFRAKVVASGRSISAKDISDIRTAIETSKNARSHLERLRIYLTVEGKEYVALAAQSARRALVSAYVGQIPDQNVTLFVAGRTAHRKIIRLGALS